jgi:dihydroorotase
MTILLRQARITDPLSPHHAAVRDILIREGRIDRIAEHIDESADQVVSLDGLHVSPGWVDIFTNGCDPGYEFKETLESLAAAGAAGGFTHLFLLPNTQPAIQNKSLVEYISGSRPTAPVSLHPLGAVTRNIDGRDLAEMYDMKQSGAIAFSDGLQPIQSAGLLIKALQYVRAFNGVVIQLPEDKSIAPHGVVNEGIVSTRMGLPGKPAMAEEIMVARDIKLARYAESRLHITGISSARSVEYVRRAKDGGLMVTCSVTPYHLFFTDEALEGYDTNLRVDLPLRSRADVDALREAVLDGTVDIITSHHQPQDWDSKVCEFEYAKPGMEGLETLFSVLDHLQLSADKIVDTLSRNPRRIFSLPEAVISEGALADLTLFVPGTPVTYSAKDLRSRSKNNAFLGRELSGKVAGTIHRAQLHLNA